MRLLLILLFSALTTGLSAQNYIKNLSFRQQGNNIIIDYELKALAADANYYRVFVKVTSLVKGELDAYAFSGDLGKIQSAGKKQIVWEVLQDVSKLKGEIEIELKAHLYGEQEKDSDGDGVLDKDDDCPNKKGPRSNRGCPEKGAVVWQSSKKGHFTDTRDNEKYEVVKIGNQVWMSETLRYNAAGSWYNPKNPSRKYGRLYDWNTAMIVCPDGWHLPTDAEWNTLEMALGMAAADASSTRWRGSHGRGMKSTTGWYKNGNGDNSSGFNAFPAGHCNGSGSYYGLGDFAGFWSASEYDATDAWGRGLYYGGAGVNRDYASKSFGYSCRCLQD